MRKVLDIIKEGIKAECYLNYGCLMSSFKAFISGNLHNLAYFAQNRVSKIVFVWTVMGRFQRPGAILLSYFTAPF